MSHLQPPSIDPENVCSSGLSSNLLVIVNAGSLHGAGLVPSTPFSRDELILPLSGKLTVRSYRTARIDGSGHLDGPLIAFMDHSCRPASIVRTNALGVFAAMALKVGDEVTFFYPSTEWKMVRPFECFCGAPDCIELVAGAQCLSSDVLTRHFVNHYVEELMAGPFLQADLG